MTEEETSEKTETKTIAEQEVEEEVEVEEVQKAKNIEKIDQLVKELNKINHKGGPDIRICPKCFSLRVKEIDTFKKMGIIQSYPVCYCEDCGWRSNKWIYLDRTLTKEERDKFLYQIGEEKV